jgi:cytidylate kinase
MSTDYPAQGDDFPSSPETQRMRAITVSRLYGSGGGEVAARLAWRLRWRLLDHEVVERIAQKLGMTHDEVVALDERTASFVERVLSNMDMGYPGLIGDVAPTPSELSFAYDDALKIIVHAAAEEGHVVIVGRGAFALLANLRDVLRVLIAAPLESRVAYVMRREGLDERAARERIRRKDSDRQRHVETCFHVRAGDPEQYDLCINTAILTLDDAVELICNALERKAHRLDVPESELGPGVGQSPYPRPPTDSNMPE